MALQHGERAGVALAALLLTEEITNFSEELDIGRPGIHLVLSVARPVSIHREHEDEVEHQHGDDERDDPVDDTTEIKYLTIDREHAHVHTATQGKTYEWSNERFSKRGDECGESRASNECHGEINDVPTGDEIAKAFEHVLALHHDDGENAIGTGIAATGGSGKHLHFRGAHGFGGDSPQRGSGHAHHSIG